MKSVTYPAVNSVKQFSASAGPNFSNAQFYTEKQFSGSLADLYYKHEDEPDFDCEFLADGNQDFAEYIF